MPRGTPDKNGQFFGGATGGRGKGRKKGVPNKTTKLVKEAILLAFDQKGGVPKLLEWAKKSEATETAFYQMWARLAPAEVTGKDGGPVEIVVRFVREAQHG